MEPKGFSLEVHLLSSHHDLDTEQEKGNTVPEFSGRRCRIAGRHNLLKVMLPLLSSAVPYLE